MRAELERTADAPFVARFGVPSVMAYREDGSHVGVSLSGPLARSNDADTKEGTVADDDRVHEMQLEPLDVYGRINEYRSQLRGELMDIQLDDGHDLDGNTLYRLNFNAVVMPFTDRRSDPGTAIFVMTARKAGTRATDSDPQLVADDVELLHAWRREMQLFLSRVLQTRVEDFQAEGTLRNPTDPKEDIALDWFLRMRLVEKFLELLEAHTEIKCSNMDCLRLLSEQGWKNKEPKKRNQRFDQLAKWLGFAYRSDARLPDFEDEPLKSGFSRALKAAGAVNQAHWPRIGPQSYDLTCLRDVEAINTTHERQSGGTGLKHPSRPSATTNAVSAAPSSPGTKSVITLSPQVRCLKPMLDPHRMRAVMRLISVIDDLKRFTTTALGRDVVFRMSIGENGAAPAELAAIIAAFKTLVPDAEQIKKLDAEVNALKPGPLPPLAQLEARCDDASFASDEPQVRTVKIDTPIEAMMAYARCRFLNSRADIIQDMLAEFIVQRVNDELPRFYDKVEPVLKNFLTVELEGCGLTACRINVRLRDAASPSTHNDPHGLEISSGVARQDQELELRGGSSGSGTQRTPSCGGTTMGNCESVADYEKLARSLVEALDKRINGLHVYEVSPRADGSIRDAMSRRHDSLDTGAPVGPMAWFGIGADSRHAESRRGIDTTVVGFSQLTQRGAEPQSISHGQNDPPETVFGWAVRPRPAPGEGWSAGNHRLSAVISVPSWWKRLDLEIKSCWITPERARNLGSALFDRPAEICDHQETAAATHKNIDSAGQQEARSESIIAFHRSFRVQLPRRIEEVTARFNFDFIKAPYFDAEWARQVKVIEPRLMVGRPGHLVLAGERLWRGTVVTVMGQPADRITVLPDMKGVIAEFDCVMPSGTDADMQRQALVTVWTSEGRTPAIPVRLLPFDRSYADDPPCFRSHGSIPSSNAIGKIATPDEPPPSIGTIPPRQAGMLR
ncbi:hypothetical protein GGE65_008210 [Skermanella aerolata]|uniref:hypothetical protein n=1 Tax=Skermanella aerolata TaxID=393310 RepID=UPI003D1A8F40